MHEHAQYRSACTYICVNMRSVQECMCEHAQYRSACMHEHAQYRSACMHEHAQYRSACTYSRRQIKVPKLTYPFALNSTSYHFPYLCLPEGSWRAVVRASDHTPRVLPRSRPTLCLGDQSARAGPSSSAPPSASPPRQLSVTPSRCPPARWS